MASRFCNFLEELVSPLFSNGENIDLQAQPDWSVILSSLEISKRCSEQEDDPSIRMIYTVCQSSLNFLSWMPNRCLSSKSFSLYATCIVNLESSLVGVSLNDLLTIIRPSMSILLSQETNGVHEFLSAVSGIKDKTVPAHWICVFFFRLYMSSRSLYRQAVSLAPPTTSKKMSEDMHDPFTAYSGNEWLENTETDDGYFSWIVQPSVSLLHVTETISEICAKEAVTNISPLMYVLTAMAIQRLVDLKRMINSFEYVVKTKDSKRLQKRLSKLTEEASGLTNFIMGHLSLLNKGRSNVSAEDGWDIAVAAIDKKSLPCAIWLLVCQNIDVWNAHASTKKLKMFLSILLKNSLPYVHNDFKQFGEHNN
nr:hypothetical protein [Tanacetum cinerariifolium]